MARKKKLRLYAMGISEDSMAVAQMERFARITPKYVLIYTKRKHPDKPEITDGNVDILSKADRQWLLDCNMALIGEEISNGRNNFVADMEIKVAELEKALINEKDKVIGNEQSERT